MPHKEIWVRCSENRNYFVSNFGGVKREHILKPLLNKSGYLQVWLGYKCRRYIHRLVAEAFIPNPDNLPEVNHRDENKQNNKVWNLEWCDRSRNNSYGTRRNRISMSIKDKWMYLASDSDGNCYSYKGSELTSKGFRQSCVYRCICGKRKTYKVFKWKRVMT